MAVQNEMKEDGETCVNAPASNHAMPGSQSLSSPSLPKPGNSYSPDSAEASCICSDWIDSFNELLNDHRRAAEFSGLFLDDACWRDLLCLAWDFHTLQGRNSIAAYAHDFIGTRRSVKFSLDDSAEHKKPARVPLDFEGKVHCLQAWFNVETDTGRGKGIVKLVDDPSGSGWRAFTLFTTLEELKGHEELIKERRPAGVRDGQDHGSANWQDKRIAEQEFQDGREPAVLILGISQSLHDHPASSPHVAGAGQGGLTLAARLKQLDVSTLLIDRNSRIGDNWRNRYHQLVLHDSVWYDPYQMIMSPRC